MAIKSEEKNENAVVSKKMPSLVISRKHKVSNVDASIANVSSKKAKRTVVRKNKKNSNNINLEAPEIKEVQEVQKVVSEIAEEVSNTNIVANKKQGKIEVTIPLEAVTSKINEKIDNKELTNEISDDNKDITKQININKTNILSASNDANTSITNKEIVKEVSETHNSDIDEISDEIKNHEDEKEKKSPTVITPDYTVHKSRISRRNLSFNLNKNLDNIVITNPKEKELDISINQNAPFFYEPSVFQKFNIDVIDADSDKEIDDEIIDSQIGAIPEKDIKQDEFNSESDIDDTNYNNNNDDNDDVVDNNINVDIQDTSNETDATTPEPEELIENNEDDINEESDQLEAELDNILTELIRKEIEISNEVDTTSESSENADTINEVTEKNENSDTSIEEAINEISEIIEIKDEQDKKLEEDEIFEDEINNQSEIINLPINEKTQENIDKSEFLDDISDDIKTDDTNSINLENADIEESSKAEIKNIEEVENIEDNENINIEDSNILEDIINDVDNSELLDDIINTAGNTDFLDELLENDVDSNLYEEENESVKENEILDKKIDDVDSVEIMKEAADNITDSKNIQTEESAPFFDSSIPKMNAEINKNSSSSFTKKSTFSNFSNIFKKFTFDEANFKNTISNQLEPISISNPDLVNNQNVLENLENTKKSVKELEVSAAPATLIIPTVNTDENQFSSANEINNSSSDVSEFYNIITPASLDTKPDSDDYEENYSEKYEESQEETQISNENIESENSQNNDISENIDDINIGDIDIDDISINDLELLDNIELNDLDTLSSTINEDEIDENYINENPIHDDTYFESSNNEEDSYLDNEFLEEDTEDSLEAENYDFESKKMSNYFSEDDEFSIEDYFGLKDLKDEITLEETEEQSEPENIEETEDTDAIEFDNTDETDSEESQEENSKTDISAFSKLIENFNQTISTLSERIADLEGSKNSNKNSYDNNEDDETQIEIVDNPEESIEDNSEDYVDSSPTEIIDNEVETENIDDINENTEIVDDNNANIFDNISLDDISLEDIGDISLEDIENLDNSDIEISDNQSNTQEEDTIEFDLPLNDNGITDEPNLFDSISVDDINLDDFSLEDIEEFEKNQSEDSNNNAKTAKDIITKTFSDENSNINDKMKSELLSELENNSDIDKALLENSNDDLSDNAVTSDLYKIIDTLAETITQLESSPDMEDKVEQIDSNEILNVPAELTGEGKAINILINKDDIFSISILNETYEIVADFDGISVLSENIHISTPKKNFFVKIGEKYIEIHNKNDNFLVYTNFEDIEFANAINNVAFAKKNNKIELNIKEAFKISSTNNIVELSMLNTSVADIVNANSDNSENIDESSICDNRTLLISEESQKVYLPYTIEEVMKKLHDSNEYQTVEEVIEKEYTVPLATFKMPIISRFKEAYRFMRVKEKSSVYAALDLALELMFTSNLNPAVIRAAKDLKELNIYLDCLYENEVDKFDCFKIIYKVLPKIK